MTKDGTKKGKKRAIALAGGGPAAGLHIGALAALEDAGITFDVFALSCVGAWVGIVYNTRERPGGKVPSRAQQTLDFFREYCFRDDHSYEWFPINRGFAPDLRALAQAWASFPVWPGLDWAKLFPLPQEIVKSFAAAGELCTWPPKEHAVNNWMLNGVLAVNPATRFLTALVYKSQINGLSRIYYDDSPALKKAFGERDHLDDPTLPEIYHNAWRMAKERVGGKPAKPGAMQIFHNRRGHSSGPGQEKYLPISHKSLCACSALPYIEQSVPIDDDEYTEGALVDTVNFANLLQDHPDLDEVWVSRIVDDSQVKPARDLSGALANLPMQFAAEVGEDDIKLFRQHLINQSLMRPRVVEIPLHPDTKVNFDWNHTNLQTGYEEGKEAVQRLLAFDPQLR
jgi:predicted acylesterase/phospholipase RssA